MSRFRETLKEDDSGKKTPKLPQKRKKKEPQYDKDSGVKSKNRLPLIGSSGNSTGARASLSTPQRPPQADPRKRARPPLSSGARDRMTPWEASSQSESSFSSFPPHLSPPPPAHSKPVPPADPPAPPPPPPQPPPQSTNPYPDPIQSAPMKRRPVPPRLPSRPPRLPPLRQISNLSFSRSFTFSFFELPVHQSARSRAERLRELTLLLRQFQY